MCFQNVLYMAILSFCGMYSCPMPVAAGSLPERSSELPCHIAMENQIYSEHTKIIVQECLKLHPLQDPNDGISIEDSERILDENQSNCALKCINENLNVTTNEGLIDVSKIRQSLQNINLPESYVLKLATIMNECEKKAGEELQTEGRTEENICKYHVLFIHCYSDEYTASRQKIYELCRHTGEPDEV